jgi:hypothetical protein
VATAFTTAPLGKMRLRSTPTVYKAAVGDDTDSLVSEVISADVVIEVKVTAGNQG